MATVHLHLHLDKQLFEQYQRIVRQSGQSIGSSLTDYMQSVVDGRTPNAETLSAIEEVQRMKQDPTLGKTYSDVDAMMQDLLHV